MDETIIGKQLSPGEIEALSRALAEDPTDEEVVRRLMIALAGARRRGESLRIYQRFAALLKSQPGHEPSPQTRAIYEAIRRGTQIPMPDDIGGGGPSEHVGMPLVGIRGTGIRGTAIQPSAIQPTGIQPAGIRETIGRSNQSPLVGRDVELVRLQGLLATAQRPPAAASLSRTVPISEVALQRLYPHCIVLLGESGIGKTRLAEEAARHALHSGWVVAWGHAYAQESGVPYRLWSELLRDLVAQGLWEVDRAEQARLFAPLVALLPELRERWADVRVPEYDQARLHEVVYDLLAAISARAPLLVVLDDVQWADGSSCELFGYVTRRLSNRPIALLGTCRETELAANQALQNLLGHMQREQVVEYLHVPPLADADIAALVSHLPDPLVQHIQAQAAGNPFFAEELALALPGTADGQTAGTMGATAGAVAGELPKTIAAALNARVQRLSVSCRQLLERAAMLGGSFSLPLILAMEAAPAEPVDEETVLDLLEEALRSGLLTEEGAGARITYRFWHPLLARHLAATLTETWRARFHRRAAAALQSVYGARPHELAEQAATITGHLVQGGAEAAQVAHFAELAANHAYVLFAYPEAERYYRLAVRCVEQMPQEETQHLAFLLERLAECVLIQGRFKEARDLFERVLEQRGAHQVQASDAGQDAAGSSDEALEAQVQALLWCEIGWTWRFTGDHQRAWECSKHGEQVLQQAGIAEGFAHARLYYQQSSLLWQVGKYEEARRAAMRAVEVFEAARAGAAQTAQVARADQPQLHEDIAHLTRIRRTIRGDPVDLGRTYALLGSIVSATGQRAEALDYLGKALALYERYDRQREIAHACNNIGYIWMKQGDDQQARSYFQRAYALAERIGDTPLMGVVLHNLGELARSSDQRDLEEAERFLRRSLLLAEQIDDREYLSRWSADLAFALIEGGQLAGAAQHTARALSVARAMHNTPCAGLALVALGTLRLAQASTCLQQHGETASRTSLQRARSTLQHALALPGLEVETTLQARIALVKTLSLLGRHEQAGAQAALAREEARRYDLEGLVNRWERVIASI
jgi:predicted ATPase